MPQDNVAIVRRVIEYLNETGKAGPLALYDPEVTFTTRGDIGGTDTFTGHAGMIRAVEMFGEAWAETKARVIDVIEGDGVVVAVLSIELKSHAGIDLEVGEAWAYWLRDGRLVRIEQHGSVEQALDAAGLSP